MLDYGRLCGVKLHIFCFAVIFFIVIFSVSFIFNLSLHSVAFETERNLQVLDTYEPRQPLKAISRTELLPATEEGNTEAYREDHGHLVSPLNVSAEERIAWFKKNLSEFKILYSTRFTRQFDARVREFFGHKCRVRIRFFMTWISPAWSFEHREFLAMESLFKANPHGCLVILSRTLDSVAGNRILKPLLNLGFKAMAVSPDLPFLLENTPAKSWLDDLKSGNKDPGEIPLAQNLSNLIRLAVLYKYGGVYMDTDFIVLKDFSGLRNSIGAQSTDESGNWTRLNNAALVFDRKHPLLYMFLEEFASTFNGNRWGHNGPYLVSRVVKRAATTQKFKFTVLPPMAFYPVSWTKIAGFFSRPPDRKLSNWVEAKLHQLNRATYGVHLWNSHSSRVEIEEGSMVDRLIWEHCIICNPMYRS
ncbi:unnamed protein product [Ilex paraguariensis]|uniref:Alpha 1,4-glycosyltransferase domain-containing protein n=1 Tax=Ilex paraguariensis TaxID=185542 RepID=A0ABC8QWH5_9AQUA